MQFTPFLTKRSQKDLHCTNYPNTLDFLRSSMESKELQETSAEDSDKKLRTQIEYLLHQVQQKNLSVQEMMKALLNQISSQSSHFFSKEEQKRLAQSLYSILDEHLQQDPNFQDILQEFKKV